MNYSRLELGERLAADYVLGMMPPRARLRFERTIADSATIAAIVAAWSDRLAPLDELSTHEPPPPRIWQAIDQRLGPSVRPSVPPARGAGWMWRWFAAVAVTAGIALVAYVAVNPMGPRDIVTALADKTGLAGVLESAKHAPADIGLSTMRLGVPERERPRWLRAALLITNDAVPLTKEPPKP